MIIRPLFAEEVERASELADLVYPTDFYESQEVFENKFLFFPLGFLGLFNSDKNSELRGYIIGHPWHGLEPVKLNSPIELKGPADLFYIHDVLISPYECYRGKGHSKELVKSILEIGRNSGFSKFLCVAVNERGKGLMEKFNFKPLLEIPYGGALSWKMFKED